MLPSGWRTFCRISKDFESRQWIVEFFISFFLLHYTVQFFIDLIMDLLGNIISYSEQEQDSFSCMDNLFISFSSFELSVGGGMPTGPCVYSGGCISIIK